MGWDADSQFPVDRSGMDCEVEVLLDCRALSYLGCRDRGEGGVFTERPDECLNELELWRALEKRCEKRFDFCFDGTGVLFAVH